MIDLIRHCLHRKSG